MKPTIPVSSNENTHYTNQRDITQSHLYHKALLVMNKDTISAIQG